MTKKINVKKIMKICLINMVLTMLLLVTVRSHAQEEIIADEIIAVVGKHIILKSNIYNIECRTELQALNQL